MHGSVSRRSSPNPEKSNPIGSDREAPPLRLRRAAPLVHHLPFRLDQAQWWWRGRPSGRAGARTHAHDRSDAGLTDSIGCDRLRGCAVRFQRRPDATACLAEDLPALCVHLKYVPRLRKRFRSSNLLEGGISNSPNASKGFADRSATRRSGHGSSIFTDSTSPRPEACLYRTERCIVIYSGCLTGPVKPQARALLSSPS